MGLDVVLLQKGGPVIYVSRTLMPAETGYPSIKKSYSASYFDWRGYTTTSLAARSLILTWKKSIVAASP